MKVLVINGSPRAKGNSDLLCDEFIRGAEEADVLLLASPTYFLTMCGQMKVMIDRLLPKWKGLGDRIKLIKEQFFLFSGDLVEQAAISPLPIAAIT